MKRLLFHLAFARANPAAFAGKSAPLVTLPDIVFADAESRENYLAALYGGTFHLPATGNPILLILGPRASGKTTLACHFAEFIGETPFHGHSSSLDLFERELNHSLLYRLSPLVIEDLWRSDILSHSNLLYACVTGRPVTPIRRGRSATADPCTPPRIVITSDITTTFHEVFLRHCRIVRLAPAIVSPSAAAA